MELGLKTTPHINIFDPFKTTVTQGSKITSYTFGLSSSLTFLTFEKIDLESEVEE